MIEIFCVVKLMNGEEIKEFEEFEEIEDLDGHIETYKHVLLGK